MFDLEKFDRKISLSNLSRLKCAREVLRQAACRYAIASAQPGERRRGLHKAGLSDKQLRSKAAAARDLAGFLRRLPNSPRIVAANDMPKTPIPVWCKDLEYMAQWIESLAPFRPDAKEAALALALHVRQRTGQQHLLELSNLLNAALEAAGLDPCLRPDTLRKQIARANRQRAEQMLGFWDSLAPSLKK